MATLIQFAFVIILKRNMESEKSKFEKPTRPQVEKNQSNIMPTHSNKILSMCSDHEMEQISRSQKKKEGKVRSTNPMKCVRKFEWTCQNTSLIAKLDFISFCLFSFGYFVFNCHYWMNYYF